MNDKKQEQFLRMTQTPVEKLIPTLAVPTIVSMLVSAVYNLADTYFVSQINTSASGAVGVVFSLMAIMQSIGFLFGMGAGSHISRMLGKQDDSGAEEIAASAVVSVFLLGCVLTLLGLVFNQPLMNVLGATDTALPYAQAYAKYIFFGAPFICTSFVMNNILRAQGKAFYSMLGLGFGSILNIALDPLFIYTFGWGISGAAIATLVSQLISFCLLLYFFLSGKSFLRLHMHAVSKSLSVYASIISTGMPSFVRQSLASIANILLNRAARVYGDPALAAMSIIGRCSFLMIAALLGFGQGFQPVAGYAYGAKNYERVRRAFRFALIVGTIFLAVASVACFLFAPNIIRLFRRDDAAVIAIGTTALRIQCLTLCVQPLVILCNMLLQTTGQAMEATIVSSARQGLFFIPLILILPQAMGLLGVQCAQPISDALSALFSVWFLLRFFAKLRRMEREAGD